MQLNNINALLRVCLKGVVAVSADYLNVCKQRRVDVILCRFAYTAEKSTSTELAQEDKRHRY